ncbi:hypothetical protein H5410_012675 [Solanum commersonii]|uniref:Pectinesterase catalytic domain-containing protein n=1 Tax=Solanum commersonii TaxID=4109 RepID=A0A9J6AT13_SOLCO|nr:hypothetical protein H5410_012675 [Solanum commersonii]
MLVGDGMDATIITGNLNVVDGATTFNSATVAAVGDGFIAQDLQFQNTAGPQSTKQWPFMWEKISPLLTVAK